MASTTLRDRLRVIVDGSVIGVLGMSGEQTIPFEFRALDDGTTTVFGSHTAE